MVESLGKQKSKPKLKNICKEHALDRVQTATFSMSMHAGQGRSK
jgi:hypothetical protein